MKKNLSDYVVALTVILCSAVLLGAMTYALSGRHGSKSDRTVEIDYPDVTGIKLHSEARYAGAAAGAVTGIRLLTFAEREAAATDEQKRNAVRVTVTLLKEVPPLPSDVHASLSQETMLSEKFVALSPGTPTAPKLASGAILQGHSGGGLDGLLDAIGPLTEGLPRLLDTADDLLKNMNPLLKNTNEAVDAVKIAVSDISPRATKLLDGLKTTSDAVDKLIDTAEPPLKADLEELKTSLLKMQTTLTSANQLLSHTDKNLDGRLQELSVVLQNLKVVSTHAKALTQAIGERPNRLIFSGKPQKLTTEEEILRTNKPLPAVKP